jgi:ABC-type uncharacterized transport system permease subunit
VIPAAIRLHLAYVRLAFARRAAYRLANLSGIAVNFFFFLIHAQVYLAFFGDRASVAGWTPQDAVLYFATSESLLMVLGAFPAWGHDLMFRIRSGAVVDDLARPVRLWARDLAERAGSSLYFLLTRSIVLYPIALWSFDLAPPRGAALLAAPLALALGIGVSGSLWYLANACAFWTEHAFGPYRATMFALGLFGGAFVPLDFYPDALRVVCEVLPFRAALYTPIAVAAGRLGGETLAAALLHQAVWLAALVAAAHVVETRGVRRLVAHGG